MNNKEYALIVAGGKGTRIKTKLPKQFLELKGKPILLHTIEAFYRYSEKIEIVLVLPEDDFEIWETICKKFNFNKPIALQKGGETRFQSVKNGLGLVEEESVIFVHDGVRCLVSHELIHRCYETAAATGSATSTRGAAGAGTNEEVRRPVQI